MKTIIKLIAVCLLLAGSAWADNKETNWSSIVTVLPTALPTAYSTPHFNTSGSRLKHIWIRNSTNEEVWCATNGSTSTSIVVPAGSTWWDNLGARGQELRGAVGCIHPSSTPASGNIVIGGNN